MGAALAFFLSLLAYRNGESLQANAIVPVVVIAALIMGQIMDVVSRAAALRPRTEMEDKLLTLTLERWVADGCSGAPSERTRFRYLALN